MFEKSEQKELVIAFEILFLSMFCYFNGRYFIMIFDSIKDFVAHFNRNLNKIKSFL